MNEYGFVSRGVKLAYYTIERVLAVYVRMRMLQLSVSYILLYIVVK